MVEKENVSRYIRPSTAMQIQIYTHGNIFENQIIYTLWMGKKYWYVYDRHFILQYAFGCYKYLKYTQSVMQYFFYPDNKVYFSSENEKHILKINLIYF